MDNHSTSSAATSPSGHHGHKKHGFTGQIGFVMAAAGSAVGVGNLWRFPYLAAKDGGTGNTGAGAARAEAAEARAAGTRVATVDLEGEGVGHGELFFMRPRTAATGTG